MALRSDNLFELNDGSIVRGAVGDFRVEHQPDGRIVLVPHLYAEAGAEPLYQEPSAREEKDEIMIFLHDYAKCRSQIVRNVASRSVTVTMDNVPEYLALHANGELFLQKLGVPQRSWGPGGRWDVFNASLFEGKEWPVVYYTRSMQRQGTSYRYSVHVPLLYAITDNKTYSTYADIYGELKGALARVPGGHHLEMRIILDYERAAIKAARRAFPRATIEGCAFHLARAWNRRRDQETWLRGPFAGIWNKWNVKTLRTSNIAETFHSNLLTEVKKKRPPLETLVKVLKSMTAQSKAILLHHQRVSNIPMATKETKERAPIFSTRTLQNH
ncbi:unnamed protein product [Heligmosomoides polygyrus]|uniref:MULE domain-containing protein n=1 Tax=Heligmosomoides polygyrus TaxID=6339 RepID=A0A183GW82_HELPZ|nr:unnamed protein product [Heligmosomoides polygyrus]